MVLSKRQCTFLSMNCIPNFTATTIPEETRRHSRRQEAYLKYKALYVHFSPL